MGALTPHFGKKVKYLVIILKSDGASHYFIQSWNMAIKRRKKKAQYKEK